MVAEAVRRPKALHGHAKPRITPPVPARSDWQSFHTDAVAMGIDLMEWQDHSARFITATGSVRYTDPCGIERSRRLYREIAIVVARQNGKTTLLKPHIVRSLRAGRRMTHIAQDRELPREMFGLVADTIAETDEDLLPRRRGKIIWPRYGSGQEEIVLTNGGRYRIAAARTGGARGHPNDDLLIDETRELLSMDIINAAAPSMRMSPDPQTIYLSNAGHEGSVVLNALRARSGKDPNLAYLEWSADPGRKADDREGWAEANPALGHFPQVLESLESDYQKAVGEGNLAGFETEALCRWVRSLRELLVDGFTWSDLATGVLPAAPMRYMGIAFDPSGKRASAHLAWRMPNESIALQQLLEATGDPIDIDALGKDLRTLARDHGAMSTGYDPLTDGQLAKYLVKPEKITGARFANASSTFRLAVHSRKLQHLDCAPVTDDLTWTAVKPHDESGSFQAVRSDDDRPITAALSAIRAVELAANPVRGAARIW